VGFEDALGVAARGRCPLREPTCGCDGLPRVLRAEVDKPAAAAPNDPQLPECRFMPRTAVNRHLARVLARLG
jgi:hypothetical protein